MTVSNVTARVKYNGNGATTSFAYSFKILVDADMRVTVTSAIGVPTTLLLNDDYTVTGAGNANGGTVVLSAGSLCPTGSTLTLLRDMGLTQEDDYVDGQGFSAESVELALDKVTMKMQSVAVVAEDVGEAAGAIAGAAAGTAAGTISGALAGTIAAQAVRPNRIDVRTYPGIMTGNDVDVAALNALILAAPNYSIIWFSAGQYNVDATILITRGDIGIEGEGASSTLILRTDGTYGDTFLFADEIPSTTSILYVGIKGVRIQCNALMTTGAHIHMQEVAGATVSNVQLQYGYKGIWLEGVRTSFFDNTLILRGAFASGVAAGSSYVHVGISPNPTGENTEVLFSNFNWESSAPSPTDNGLVINECDGIWFSNGHIMGADNADCLIDPIGSDQVLGLMFNHIWFDGNCAKNLVLQGVGTNFGVMSFSNCRFWGATEYAVLVANDSNLQGAEFDGCSFGRSTAEKAVQLQSGARISFAGCMFEKINRTSLSTTADHIYVGGTTTMENLNITGSTFDVAEPIRHGLNLLDSGTTIYHITGNTFNNFALATGEEIHIDTSDENLRGRISGNTTDRTFEVAAAATLYVPAIADVVTLTGSTATVTTIKPTWEGRELTLRAATALQHFDESVHLISSQGGAFSVKPLRATKIKYSYGATKWLQVGDNGIKKITTIADLRTYTAGTSSTVYVEHYATEGDGGGGTFRYDGGEAPGTFVDNNGTIIVPTGGDGSAAWLRVAQVDRASARISPDNSYKKKIRLVLPYRHADYAAAVAAFGSQYPQTFVVDEVAAEIFVISVVPNTVSVFDWNTGAYKRVFGLGAMNVSEGAVIRYVGGTRYLYVRQAVDTVARFDITTLPTNLSTITAADTYAVDTGRNITYRGGIWTVLDDGYPLGTIQQRNRFVRYDDSFARVGDLEFPILQTGLHEDVENATEIPKLQGLAAGDGFYVMGVGGSHAASAAYTPYGYQGIRVFAEDGTLTHAALCDPERMIDVLGDNGLSPTRVENEGVWVSSDNRIYSLTVTASSSTATEIATEEGIVIFEEFSRDFDAVDFSSAAISWTAPDVRLLQSGIFPRSKDGKLYSPITGTAMENWDTIMDYMISANQAIFRYYSTSVAILDIDEVEPVAAGVLVEIQNLNNGTFLVTTKSVNRGVAQTWRVSGSSGARTQVLISLPPWIDNTAHTVTGTTAETTLYTVSIPGGTMGASGALRITTLWSHTGSVNDKFLRVKFDGTAFMETNRATAGDISYQGQTTIRNRNDAASQIGHSPSANSHFTSSSVSVVTAAIDTATAKTLAITGQLETSGESITLESVIIEVVR